ncbi:hypothetical protein B0G84_2363 [Paraburkholderia sp. BL8N3]|nr:hypothetical protein [Paraburkholderia sp. BL8N3]TCK44015.1 hypothetical protein B0G84_2363 [Paraburkholderia sp. BL8N3]
MLRRKKLLTGSPRLYHARDGWKGGLVAYRRYLARQKHEHTVFDWLLDVGIALCIAAAILFATVGAVEVGGPLMHTIATSDNSSVR